MITTSNLFLENEARNILRFVIHEHHADRAGLHYDIRLEKDGVLKSFVTRKLPMLLDNEATKIMLIPTPDHDLEWIDFQGDIEDGYGKGLVRIYDSGKYELLKWDTKHIVIKFHGKKLIGKFALVKVQDNWIFLKMKEYTKQGE